MHEKRRRHNESDWVMQPFVPNNSAGTIRHSCQHNTLNDTAKLVGKFCGWKNSSTQSRSSWGESPAADVKARPARAAGVADSRYGLVSGFCCSLDQQLQPQTCCSVANARHSVSTHNKGWLTLHRTQEALPPVSCGFISPTSPHALPPPPHHRGSVAPVLRAQTVRL